MFKQYFSKIFRRPGPKTAIERPLGIEFAANITLELTTHCNLRCRMCARQFNEGFSRQHMDLAKAKKIVLDNISTLNTVALTDYGETFLYPQLYEIMRYIYDLNPKINIFIATNATIPGIKGIIEKIIDIPFALLVSIDGVGDTYEKIRVNANYARFLSNVREISETLRDRQFLFNMVVVEDNYHEMCDVIELAHELGNVEIQVNPLNISANSDWGPEIYYFYYTELFQKELERASLFAEQNHVRFSYPLISRLFEPKSTKDCPYFWDNFTISCDGYLKPCCGQLMIQPNFGNVFEKGLIPCINSPEFLEIRRLSLKGIAPRYCHGCNFLSDDILNHAEKDNITINLRDKLRLIS